MTKRLAFVFFLVGLWVLLICHLAREWWSNPQYGYGLVVPLLCGWILWQRRGELADAFSAPPPPASKRAGFWLCTGALLLLPLELYRQIAPGLRGFGVGGALLCFALTFWTLRHLGMRRVPGVLKGCALLFAAAVPWPTTIESEIVQRLMRMTAELTAEVLNWAGILAVARGNLVEIDSGLVSIDEACSGVRSLQSCLMASIALGLMFRLPARRTAALVVLGQALAIFGNALRSMILTGTAAVRGIPAVEKFHDPAGWSILIGVTVVLYLIAAWWEQPRAEAPTRPMPPLDWTRLPRTRAALAIAALALLGAHGWYIANEQLHPARNSPSLILNPKTALQVNTLPVPDRIREELQPQSGAYYMASSPGLGEASVYYFFWAPSPNNRTAFFHRPDICLPAVGWEMTGEVEELIVPLGSRNTRWYLFHFRNPEFSILQAWGIWRDGESQVLNFDRGWRRLWGQQVQRWHFIEQGKRETSTEIASVAMDARNATREDLVKMIQQFFAFNPGPN